MICNYCEWHCDLSKGSICGQYIQQDGLILEKRPYDWADFYVYTIESMPFYHVLPGEYVVQSGTVSCNAHCSYCINSHLAIKNDENRVYHHKNKEQLLRYVKKTGCRGICFSLNEITCFMPSAIEIADYFHENGLLIGCLTNGFQSEETAKLLACKMDFINVSLKSLSDDFYKNELGLFSVNPVLRNIRIFSKMTHLEIVTPLVKEIIDKEIYQIRDFLYDVDPEIVWHLFRLMPNYEKANERDMSYEQMLKVYKAAKEKLPFTYLGNFAGSRWIDTYCPDCGSLLIKRLATGAWMSGSNQINLKDGCCPKCGRKIPGVFDV